MTTFLARCRDFGALRAAVLAALGLGAGLAVATQTATQTVTIGAEDDAAPWSYPDGTGYVNDLVRAAFKEAGWTMQQKVMPYARCKALAAKGDLAGCFAVGRRPDMEASFLYPDEPIVGAQNLVVARSDSPLSGCDPFLWGPAPRIGFVRGYEYVERVEALGRHPKVKIDTTNSELINLRKVQAGHIQAAVINVDEVKQIDYIATLAGVDNDFKTVCNFGALPIYVGFSRAHPQGAAALAAYNAGFAALQARGEVAAMQLAWRVRALHKISVVKQ
jgi:polar amino acid transport system substrate-binding protein